MELEGFDCPQACVRWHPKHAYFFVKMLSRVTGLALPGFWPFATWRQVQMWHQPAAKRHV